MSLHDFKDRFGFNPELTGHIGVEREYFVANRGDRNIIPLADKVIAHAHKIGWKSNEGETSGPGDTLGYELSNAQLEMRTRPHSSLLSLREELEHNDRELIKTLEDLGLVALHTEVGPPDMPLDIYPDPTGRYQAITKNMPRDTLSAACRVIGTHVHIGMHDHGSALQVYNHVLSYLGELCEIGNGSFGERLAIYRRMAPDYEPKPYASWDDYYQTALMRGFAEDPRKCWTLVRISVHGTLEFRMFGATDSIDRVVNWASRCHALCEEAISLL